MLLSNRASPARWRKYVFDAGRPDAMLAAAMVGSHENYSGAAHDGAQPVRTIIVAGQSSQRTREVLRALRGVGSVIWPKSLEAALEWTSAAHVACLVIADDLHEEPQDDFLQEARELHRSLPIFVITAPDDVAEAVSAMRHGATAVIEIPPSYAALREEVTRALQ